MKQFLMTLRARQIIPALALIIATVVSGYESSAEEPVASIPDQSPIDFATFEAVLPGSVTAIRGTYISGTLEDTFVSDDQYLRYGPGITINHLEPPAWLLFNGNTSLTEAVNMQVLLEASANTTGLRQTVSLFNWNTLDYDLVDTSQASFNVDSVTNVMLPVAGGNYIQKGTGAIRMRTGWRATGISIVFPWAISVDGVLWRVSE